MSDEHIATVTKLFGDFVEASLVTVLDAEGKEASRQVLMDGETLPKAPNGGKVKKVPISRIFRNEDFGYRTITVERPLRDDKGQPVLFEKGKAEGKPQPDSSLRDTENVPLSEDVETYFKREVAAPRAGRLDRPREDQSPMCDQHLAAETPELLAHLETELTEA